MGCLSSRAIVEERRDLFQVWNVDDKGNHVSTGKIELTHSELILYQKRKPPIRWPLQSLRRYGYDSELFSFECGRKCSTGPAIYAFKCHHAEALFNLLQKCIQNCTSGDCYTEGQIGEASASSGTRLSQQGPAFSLHDLVPVRNSNIPSSSTFMVSSPTNSSTQNSNQTKCTIRHSFPEKWSTRTAALDCFICHCSVHSCKTFSTPSPHYMNEEIVILGSQHPRSSFSSVVSHPYVNSSVIQDTMKKSITTESLHQKHSYVNVTVDSLNCIGYKYLNDECSGIPCSPESGCNLDIHIVDINTNYTRLDELWKQDYIDKHENEDCYVNGGLEQISVTCGQTDTITSDDNFSCVCPARFTREIVTSQISQNDNSHMYINTKQNCVPANQTEEIQMKYITLDLQQKNKSGCISSIKLKPTTIDCSMGSAHQRPEGYATIDFEKTMALLNSANPTVDSDDSIRKTRHSGTMPSGSL
ncbi:uncharacterized protein LOC111085039 [Limulus polyphemus]|uniref:Uncharacterized protein LOC111085039 n=1 Tax=Limulus polyphemus TaxID=6850 RepID=A0ABM1S284_LIMPO|nr:uncharacterized protein LOC111085039 [Limulus polyphemus]